MLKGLLTFSVHPLSIKLFLTLIICVTVISFSPSPVSLSVSQANRNCLVMASTHDIQELDVSSILATQILTWIDDDEVETKG